MTQLNKTDADESNRGTWFTTTHWSLVLHAQATSAPQADAALEKLCRTYWYPLYAYVRRKGEDEESARDLTQGFFARLLEKNYLDQVRREKGKFRSFLLAALNHFMLDEWDKARAQKRGGGHPLISLDDSTSEDRYHLEPADIMSPERLYERRCALTLLGQAQERLKQEHVKGAESRREYDCLKVFLTGDNDAPSYANVAVELGLTEDAVKAAIFRLRKRYRELVREEVANTVDSPEAVDEEIRYMITVISR